MAANGRRQVPSVEAELDAHGERFDFFQAIALIEGAAPEAASVGTGPAPHREAVSLRSSIAMSFPAADLHKVHLGAMVQGEAGEPDPQPLKSRGNDGKSEITVRLMGLAGALGPLPGPFAELVYRRAVNRDHALRDFLDIFNHRLLSILYRSRKHHRLGLGVRSVVDDDAARYLFALIGLGTPGLRDRLGMPDRALLHYAGLFGRSIRTMAGLEVLLRRHFGVKVSGAPLTGRLCVIEPDDRTAIGPSGRRRALGRDAMIGERVWIQDAAFELSVGPLSAAELTRYLPGGDALRPMCAAIDIYAGDVVSYSLRLLAEPGSTPQARLGKRHGARLGYTAWLGPGKALQRKRGLREIHLSVGTLAHYRGPPPAAAGQGTTT